jgi:hypothetical protein
MARTLAAAASAACGLLALLSLTDAARAQSEPVLRAEASLPDGRAAQVFALNDRAGYRLDVADALWSGGGDGEPVDVVIGDVDGDGAADVTVLMTSAGGGARRAEVWDVTSQGPMLMHVSSALVTTAPALGQLRGEIEERFTPLSALSALQYASLSLAQDDRDVDAAALKAEASQWLETARGALIYAEVARARAAAKAAGRDDADAQLDLRLALEARAKFAAGLGASAALAPPTAPAVPAPPLPEASVSPPLAAAPTAPETAPPVETPAAETPAEEPDARPPAVIGGPLVVEAPTDAPPPATP